MAALIAPRPQPCCLHHLPTGPPFRPQRMHRSRAFLYCKLSIELDSPPYPSCPATCSEPGPMRAPREAGAPSIGDAGKPRMPARQSSCNSAAKPFLLRRAPCILLYCLAGSQNAARRETHISPVCGRVVPPSHTEYPPTTFAQERPSPGHAKAPKNPPPRKRGITCSRRARHTETPHTLKVKKTLQLHARQQGPPLGSKRKWSCRRAPDTLPTETL